MHTTQEQKDIVFIKEEIGSVRSHLKTIKERQDSDDISRVEFNRKLDLIVNALTDNDFNSKNGYLTRLNNMEKMLLAHDLYWRVLMIVVLAGGLLAGAIKYLLKF